MGSWFLTRTHHSALWMHLHSFRVVTPSCTSQHQIHLHPDDYCAAQRHSGLHMRRSSICSNDICQNIARGVSPFAHMHEWLWHNPVHQKFLFCESILSCLPSECIMPCLHDLLEFRRAQRVPRFGDLLAFILITISVSSEFETFDKKLMFVMCSGVARRATWEATPSHMYFNRSACVNSCCLLLLVGGSAVSRIHGFQRKERISPTHICYLK